MRLRYDNLAFGRRLRHSLQGSAKYALVRRTLTRYSETVPAHRPPEFDGSVMDAPAGVPPILHANFRTVAQTQEKVLRYAESRADQAERIDDPIALLRAVNVPARLVSVYAPGCQPMDFHAVAEAFVDGQWRVVDATLLAPRQSLVRIATGRDAADTAFLDNHNGAIALTLLSVTAITEGVLPTDAADQLATLH